MCLFLGTPVLVVRKEPQHVLIYFVFIFGGRGPLKQDTPKLS